MPREVPEQLKSRIQVHALALLGRRKQTTTNLSLVNRVYESGELIGPALQGIRSEGACVVVFADDEPLANFGHPCRYLLYDAETGKFIREVSA